MLLIILRAFLPLIFSPVTVRLCLNYTTLSLREGAFGVLWPEKISRLVCECEWVREGVVFAPAASNVIQENPHRDLAPRRGSMQMGSPADFISRWRGLWCQVSLNSSRETHIKAVFKVQLLNQGACVCDRRAFPLAGKAFLMAKQSGQIKKIASFAQHAAPN
jgi:hypothetical protein